jgi:hypothetical protein
MSREGEGAQSEAEIGKSGDQKTLPLIHGKPGQVNADNADPRQWLGSLWDALM